MLPEAVHGQVTGQSGVESLSVLLVGSGPLHELLRGRLSGQKMSLQMCSWEGLLTQLAYARVDLLVLVAEELHEQKLLITQQAKSMLRSKGAICGLVTVSREMDAEDVVSWLGQVDDLLMGENVENERVFFARLKARLRPIGFRVDWHVGSDVVQRRDREVPVGGEVEQHVVGPIVVWPAKFEVRVSGKPVSLTLTQFRLLELLVRRPGWILTPVSIRETLGLESGESGDAVVKNHVYMLRRRLGKDAASLIETVRGVGYRIRAEESQG